MVNDHEINQLYNKLLGRDCEDEILKKLIRNKFSLDRIERSVLHSDEYKERRNVIFNFDKWVEFGERYTYILKDKEFTEPPVTSNNNLVFIDFRYLDNMEFVIRNALLRLDGAFMVTFVCGPANYDDVKILCSEISENIKVVKLDEHVNNNIDYNKLLLDKEFWKMLDGEKILIHQFDAFILKNNIEEFLSYDYLGSPCYYEGKELIYNGGFSIRTKQVMIDLLETHKPKDISEDIFFSRNMEIHKEISSKFSFQEEETDAFGCHQMWKVKEFSHSEFYDKLKYEKSDIYKYPNLFHKFILGIRNPYDPIKYEIKQDYFEQKELVAHLHCYDIEKFDEFYGYKIEEIVKYYFTIVTFSKGNYKGGIDNVVVLKHENRGADVGGKFVCNRYLKDIEYKYTHILCLQSKTDKGKRNQYFKVFLEDIENVISKINNNIGCMSLPIIITNEKILNHKNYDNMWDRNERYMLEIEDYMNIKDHPRVFPEGNVYILHKDVFVDMFSDLKLFNSLNMKNSFDFLWTKTYYQINDNIQNVYFKYKNDKLYGNNFDTNLGWNGLADCMIEHIFERLVFGISKKLKYSIEILDNNLSFSSSQFTNFIFTKRVNFLNNSPITIISCHTSNDYKYKAILNNIKYFCEVSNDIYVVNSTEFRGEIEKIIDKETYIVNDDLTNLQVENYKMLNKDLSHLSEEQCKTHWKNNGKYENRKIDFKKIYIRYYENDHLLCQGKWHKMVTEIGLENSYILTNDSFFIVNSLEPFYKKINSNFEMIGISQSNEIKYHYTDFLRYYNDIGIKKILDFYSKNFHKCKTFSDVIENLEINSISITDNRDCVYKVEENYYKNLHFDDKVNENYLNNGYPIIKIKRLTLDRYNYKEMPLDFNPDEYKRLHADLLHMENSQALEHFIVNGFKEGRRYKKSQKKLPDYLEKYVTSLGLQKIH